MCWRARVVYWTVLEVGDWKVWKVYQTLQICHDQWMEVLQKQGQRILHLLLQRQVCSLIHLNWWFSKYLVSSESIPFSAKVEFVATTTMRLMAHVFDMARDIIQIIFLRRLINGAPYIFTWVSTLSSLINMQLHSHVLKAIFHYACAYQRPCTLYEIFILLKNLSNF